MSTTQLRNTCLALGIAAAARGSWWFSDRAPYPYSQHRLLDLQLPILTNANLDRLLRPRPGERMLEIGPGTGLQAVHIAPQLGALGTTAAGPYSRQVTGSTPFAR